MLTTRKNALVKSVSAVCFESVKKAESEYGIRSFQYQRALFEYELAVRSSDSKKTVNGRPQYRNMDFGEICGLFSRKHGGHCGATKRTHTHHPDGWEMELFVVKRYRSDGWDFHCNQLVDEIRCWVKLAETPDADFLCPILKYETAKSDKCQELSDTMKERVCIVAQKAVYVDDLAGACEYAERMNRKHGKYGVGKYDREDQLKAFAKRMGWRDVVHNTGNSGVIFDYAENCYKAVFIDYAL